MDVCRSWFRKKSGLARCAAQTDSLARKCNSLPVSARQFTFRCNSSLSSSSSSSDTPTEPTPQLERKIQHAPKKELLSKKERRELLKARVEALRSRLRDSSTDDDENGTPTPDQGISKRTRSKSQSNDDARTTRMEKYMRRSRNPLRRNMEISLKQNGGNNSRTWSLDRGTTVKEEVCSMLDRRGKFYRASPPPPPPPRTSKMVDNSLPPPPPVRHNQRPVSFAFENGLNSRCYYSKKFADENGVGTSRCRSQTSDITNVYMSDSQVGSPVKPIPPAIPPRRGSLQVNAAPPPHNLEDALKELERIYCTLKTKDEPMDNYTTKLPQRPSSNLSRMSKLNVSASMDSLTSREKDDLAYRRMQRNSRPPTPASLPTGSYLLFAPHLSPTETEASKSRIGKEPDTVKDDVNFRIMRDANRHVLHEKSVFGIPNQNVTSISSDYLRPSGTPKARNVFQQRFTPDEVQDDMALRNLRKDINKNSNSINNQDKVNTEELDAILRSNSKPVNRKYRAVKSLSANISHLVLKRQPSVKSTDISQSMSDLLAAITAEEKMSREANLEKRFKDEVESEENRPKRIWQIRVSNGDVSTQLSRSRSINSDTDVTRDPQRGKPIDEISLDELLHSLSQETDEFQDRGKVCQSKGSFFSGRSFKSALENNSPPQTGQKLMGGNQSCTGRQSGSSSTAASKDVAENELDKETQEKNERINKYKDRRRKQLASKYGDWSSSEDVTSVGEEPSYVRFSNRYKNQSRTNVPTSPHPHDPGGSGDAVSTNTTSGFVRSNRASRLRALASCGQENASGELTRSASFRAKLHSDEDNFQRGVLNRRSFNGSLSSTPEKNGKNNYSSQTYTSSSDTVPAYDGWRKPRDKSGKRKSNLNRSLIVDVNQELSRDDSFQRWRRANKLDNRDVVMSEGSTPYQEFRDENNRKSPDKQLSLKRPEIPHVLLQGQACRERSFSSEQKNDQVKSTESATVTYEDESEESNSVNRVCQLAQLVEVTTAKVGTLTNIAAESSHVSTGLSLKSGAKNLDEERRVIAKPPVITAQNACGNEQYVSRIRGREKFAMEEEVVLSTEIPVEENVDVNFSNGEVKSVINDRNPMLQPILKRNSVDEGNSALNLNQINRRIEELTETSKCSEEIKSQPILKLSGLSSESEELPHHGILKRRSSVDGGDPKPILKKRSSVEESDQLKPILKVHRSDDGEENLSSASSRFSGDEQKGEGNSDLRPILKRQRRLDGPPTSILKSSSVGEMRRPSILKTHSTEENFNSTADEGEKNKEEEDDVIPLLPSILKKKSKETVHPLANPFTEIASILKSKQPRQVIPKAPLDVTEGITDEKRISVAERITQMETKLADETHGSDDGNEESRLTKMSQTTRVEVNSSRRIRERFSARYHTQPITFNEVKNSAPFGESKENAVNEIKQDTRTETQFRATICLQRSKTQPISSEEIRSVEESDEDPCKMSLAERVHFFDRRVMEERFNLQKNINVQQEHSKRRNSSRYRTQPITFAEVEKAQQNELKEKVRNVDEIEKRQHEQDNEDVIKMNGCTLSYHSPPKVHPPTIRERAVIVMSSSNDEDSSGPGFRDNRRVIKNEAINRRRNATLRRKDERRSMCDLYSGVGIDSRINLHQRSNTAPLTKIELDGIEDSPREVVSIADRLAALRKNGEESWKERIQTKDEQFFTKHTVTTISSDVDVDVRGTTKSLASIREKRRSRDDRPSSIVDRISQLGVAQQGWKQRVEEKDSTQFTVAGRMGYVENDTQVIDRVRRVPKPNVFTPSSQMIPLQRSTSEPVCNTIMSMVKDKQTEKQMSKIVIPKIDDESFNAFFESILSNESQATHVEVSDDGFQEMTSSSRQMLVQRKNVVRQRRTAMASGNPIKMLASRSDIQNEYEEVNREDEMRRLKSQQIGQSSNLAVSALAGLASTEDFSAVNLKKRSSFAVGSLLPFKDLMLIQVKGRRHVQTRLVEPKLSSLNRGDNYIIVTPNHVVNWIGRFSNVIERSKGSEIASTIQSKRDLGYSSSEDVITIDEEKNGSLKNQDEYLKLLGGEINEINEAGNPKEDELYENAIIDTNMVYEVEENRLVPHPQCWGTLPKIEMLDSNKVLVFDFGSEMYVWQGKLSPMSLRKSAIHLAQELWNQGYNYSECLINPLCPSLMDDEKQPAKRHTQRPKWSLFGKVNQHMETILFREKFVDWPESQQVILVKAPEKNKIAGTTVMVPYDANVMLNSIAGEPDLILEGSHIGRGKSYWDADSRRHYEITTLGIKVWHVSEKGYKLLPRESWSQFYTGDTNVVRWQYMITVTGRDLSGRMSRHSFVGRERCAYFFWQGYESTVNNKGASALMTVELDEERGPHVRVDEGHEPPCFLALFDGAMIIHKGKRRIISEEDIDEENNVQARLKSDSTQRLYIVRSTAESEACLVEIEAKKSSLRSRGSLVFVDVSDGFICVWHGCKSEEHTRQVASAAANILEERRPLEIGFEYNLPLRLEEISEGNDKSLLSLLECHGEEDDQCCLYDSLVKSPLSYDFTPRLFHMTSVSGAFTAVEIQCPFRCSQFSCAFPFLQSDLYDSDQPSLFVLDNEHCVYLWQGWWPEPNDDNDNIAIGSAKVRWNTDRRCAMETVLNYCKEKNSSSPPPAYLVSAGVEPVSFTNLFPKWVKRDDVTALNIQEGKKKGESVLVNEVLPHLSRSCYTLEELQDRPLPEGVNPSRIESYLDPNDFENLLGMTPAEFYVLPAWKQHKLKQIVKLF